VSHANTCVVETGLSHGRGVRVVEKVGAVVNVDDHKVKADANGFKEYVESRAQASGAWRGDV
jgi:hypothetical protein